MATKDYLHSDLIVNEKNSKVFEKTYEVIDNIANKHTEIMRHAFGIDKKYSDDLSKVNAIFYSDEIIELVNFTIENFKK